MYEQFFQYPNVVGAGYGVQRKAGGILGTGLVVMVTKKLPLDALESHEVIPRESYWGRVDVMEVGHIEALRKDKVRPAPPGVSIGHYRITAGTFGAVVMSEYKVILSNNHVLANSNDAEPGDPILQPGPADGGTLEDKIAVLLRFVPIKFLTEPPTCGLAMAYELVSNTLAKRLGSAHRVMTYQVNDEVNLVDAAIALPVRDEDILDEVLEIGEIKGTVEPVLGMEVKKSGRTTGITEGRIEVIGATLDVGYGSKKARFVNQIVTSKMVEGGDSGSLLVHKVDCQWHAVGLVFAGSPYVGVHNPIDAVCEELEIRF